MHFASPLRSPLLFSVLLAFASPARAFRVDSFTPQGTVKNVRQVVARFSEAMIPFGDPRPAQDPFAIDCGTNAPKGHGRWVDAREWAYDFEADVAPGHLCHFRLRPETRSAKNGAPDASAEFRFNTGGPAIRQTNPYAGSDGVREDQVFILTLDTEIDPASLKGQLFFNVEGIASRVAVRAIEGDLRRRILRATYVEKDKPALVIQPERNFPNDARVELVWGKNIRTKSGAQNEADQKLEFRTRKALRAEFSCTRENADAACSPIGRMEVNFTAAIPRKLAHAVRLKLADGRLLKPNGADGKSTSGEEAEEDDTTSGAFFDGPFPENATFEVILPPNVRDEAGRKLENQSRFPLGVRTQAYPPLAKFPGWFGIVEHKAGGLLPVTLRRLEPQVAARLKMINENAGGFRGASLKVKNTGAALTEWLSKMHEAEDWEWRHRTIFEGETAKREFRVPKPGGANAFEVVGIPLTEPGLYVVELESPALGRSLLGVTAGPMRVRTAALVTNLAVHFKWGRESSLAWVTSLDRGEAVGGATVEVFDCRGQSLWNGRTDAQGRAVIQKYVTAKWREAATCQGVNYPFGSSLMVVAKLGADMSFTNTGWTQGLEAWRYQIPTEWSDGEDSSRQIHAVFDRTLLRAGDTVHMKILARQNTMSGFRLVPPAKLPTRLTITHAGSDQKVELKTKWDASGVALAEWKIPNDAKLGSYSVTLQDKFAGSFNVAAFRVPLMKAQVQADAPALVAPARVPLRLSAQYLAGGPAGKLPVKIRSLLSDSGWHPGGDFDDYQFGATAVKEGLRRNRSDDAEDESAASPARGKEVKTLPTTLDDAGGARVEVPGDEKLTQPRRLEAEMEYMDPNGATQTTATSVTLLPASRMVGIARDAWNSGSAKEIVKLKLAVVDAAGKPVPKAKVEVTAFANKSYSHRKRLVGGFFSYESFEETRKLGALCAGETDAKGLLVCEAKAPQQGRLILQAVTRDEQGRASYASADVWVYGDRNVWFASDDNDRMDLLPEKKLYEPGETARIQVRMPFREATALIAVEREGVIDSFVRRLDSKNPVVEVPIRRGYAPNVFVSAFVVRGRVDDAPPPSALADLAKPAFRMGVTEVKVGWRNHMLRVDVKPEREEYRVREKARVRVHVETRDGTPLPAPAEVAVAVVDEGLLNLRANDSWKILRALMGQRSYQVEHSSAQTFVIGKRHFGQKALPPGGSGGQAPTRELFDTLLLWKPRVALDAKGDAEVEVPLNDSVTSFRVVAIATAGADRFDDGGASIRATQDLMLVAGLPPLVRNGDRFPAQLTVRNASARAMSLEAKGRCVSGCAHAFPPQRLELRAGEARTIEWPVEIPASATKLEYLFEAQDAQNTVSDRVKVTQRAIPAVPVRAYQAQLDRLEGAPFSLKVQRPAGALPDRGEIRLTASASLSHGALDGVQTAMSSYPYGCLEQRVSKAIALDDPKAWDAVVASLPAHRDAAGFLKYFPSSSSGSAVLTAYVLSVADEAKRKIPEDFREGLVATLQSFVAGRARPADSAWAPPGALVLEKLTALEAISRSAQVEPKVLDSIAIEPNLWPSSALVDWTMALRRSPHWPKRTEHLAQAEQILRARLNYQGSTVGLSDAPTTNLFRSWFMSSTDADAARVLLNATDDPAWKDELPRLVRGAIARQRAGRWDLTTANAWGALALRKFSGLHEKEPVDGTLNATLAAARGSARVENGKPAAPVALPWPEQASELKASFVGTGKPWLMTQSLAALPLREPLSTGFRIEKKLEAVLRKRAGAWSVGDVIRVRLRVDAQADTGWVVVDDPVPAGSQVLGAGLDNESQLAQRPTQASAPTPLWPAYQERSFEGLRSYYDYVPKGVFEVEYSFRLNQAGKFRLPTTRTEAMYAPEMLGEIPNAEFEVQP